MDSYQEEYWLLGAGWRQLRHEVMCSLDITPITLGLEGGVESFCEGVKEAVHSLQRRLASQAESGSYTSRLQLSLLGDSQSLIDNLQKDYQTLVAPNLADTSPEKIVFSTFKQYLENSRRDILPGSQHRRKVWERVKSCAEKCERLWFAEQPSVSWLDVQFLCRLLDWLQLHYPDDKNLPRTLVGLEAYIYEFGNSHLDLEEAELDHLIDQHWCLVSGTSHQEALEECLNRLASSQPVLWEAISVKFGLGRVQYLQIQHHMQETGLSRRQYQRQVSDALSAVRTCMTEKIRWDWEDA